MENKLIPHLFNDSQNLNDFKNLYVNLFQQSLEVLKKKDLNPFFELLLKTHKNNKRIYFCGNGGSAANANHFSCGISYITDNFQKPIKSFSLSSDAHLITSISNDYGYDQIFKKQLEVHLEKDDLLVCFSVSGQSKNILEAAKFAKTKETHVFAFLGHNGGELKTLADSSMHIQNEDCLFGITEDVHMIIGHLTCYYLKEYFVAQSRQMQPSI